MLQGLGNEIMRPFWRCALATGQISSRASGLRSEAKVSLGHVLQAHRGHGTVSGTYTGASGTSVKNWKW